MKKQLEGESEMSFLHEVICDPLPSHSNAPNVGCKQKSEVVESVVRFEVYAVWLL
jgi:hypothetical protein